MKNIISTNNIATNMKNNNINELTKSQLIDLVLNQNAKIKKLFKIINEQKTINEQKRPVPTTRKSVRQMVQEYEDDIIQPPLEFRDDYKPIPTSKKNAEQMIKSHEDNIIQPPLELRDDYKPIPLPRTKIEKVNKAFKGYAQSFEISIQNKNDPLSQLQNTRRAIEDHIKNILPEMKGIKFLETLQVTLKKPRMDGNKQVIEYQMPYFNSKSKIITNNSEIHDSLQLSKEQILNFTAKWISEGSGWTIESIDNHHLNIVQFEPIKASSYIKLPTELRNNMKGLINPQNEDNECFRWCHIRHLNPQNKDPQRIIKSDKEYINKLKYDGIKFPVTVEQYNKIEKQNKININVFGYENKKPYPIYISKKKNLKIIWNC